MSLLIFLWVFNLFKPETAIGSVIYYNDFNDNAYGWQLINSFSWNGSYLISSSTYWGEASYYYDAVNDGYALFKIEFLNLPSATLMVANGASDYAWGVSLFSGGAYIYTNNMFMGFLGSLNENEWHLLRLRWQLDNNRNGYICGKLDDNSEQCSPTGNYEIPDRFFVHSDFNFSNSTGCIMLIDDVELGSGGNSYPTPTPTPTPTPSATTTIQIIQPQNNDYIFDGKSNFWKIGLEGLSTIPNLPQLVSLRVNYWNVNFPDIIYRDEVYPVLIPENPANFSTYLDKNTPLFNGEYQAQAELILGDNTTYKSEVNYFVIIGGTSPSPSPPVYPSMSPYPSTPPELSPPPYAGSEEICQSPPGGFLDYPVQNLTYAICKAFTFLFLPSESQRNTLSSFLNNWSDNLKKSLISDIFI